jgi:hypothetical protein
MQQNPSQANSRQSHPEIPRTLYDAKVNNRVQKSPQWSIRAQKKIKRSAGEELTQTEYSDIETVMIDCKLRLAYNQ